MTKQDKKLRENISNIATKIDLCCPYCKEKIQADNKYYKCLNSQCFHSNKKGWFNSVQGKPILISEHYCDTVFSSHDVRSRVKRRGGSLIKSKLNNMLFGYPDVTKINCSKFIDLLQKNEKSRKCLIIGSGEKGRGTEDLIENNELSILGTDVYESDLVDVISDAHYLPFEDESFDGVWIQAVLEHVVDPQIVVEEIYRVLKPDGVVYAETPFMQQVHEGRYDFTRFTVLGHRYLFKRFKSIDIGGNKGAEIALTWSIKYFFWALTRSKHIGTLFSIPFAIILRFIGKFVDNRSLFDASSGVYFLGIKSDDIISHKDLIELYKGMQN